MDKKKLREEAYMMDSRWSVDRDNYLMDITQQAVLRKVGERLYENLYRNGAYISQEKVIEILMRGEMP